MNYNEAVELAGMVFIGFIVLIIAGSIVHDAHRSTRRKR